MSHILGVRFQLNGSTRKGVWQLAGEENGIPYVQLESYVEDLQVGWGEYRKREDGSLYYHHTSREEWMGAVEVATRHFADPWELLQDFTSLKSVAALLKFLNVTGHFCNPYADEAIAEEEPDWIFDAGDLRYGVTDFWMVQELLVQMLLSRCPLPVLDPAYLPAAWLAVFNEGFQFRIKKSHGEYVAEVTTIDTLPTMIAIAQLKIMREGKFRVCKRPDCSRLFEYETRGRRENRYCSHLCAHTDWQRRTRKTKVEIRDERKQFGYGHYKKSR
jgi:hypothetical protein